MIQTIGRMLLGAAIFRSMRRSPLAIVIGAAVVGLLLMSAGKVEAQTAVTREQAYQQCRAFVDGRSANYPRVAHDCRHDPSVAESGSYWAEFCFASGCGVGQFQNRRFFYTSAACPNLSVWDDATNSCVKNCQAQPDRTIIRPGGISGPRPSGTTQCIDSCPVSLFSNGDGTYTGKHIFGGMCDNTEGYKCSAGELAEGFYNSTLLGGCVPNVEECAANEVKDPITGECSTGCPVGMVMRDDGTCKAERETCPPGNIKAPDGSCLPGEGQCAAGEARGKDGTCKRDTDGDGTPDSEQGDDPQNSDGTEFSGGDDCSRPPTCSGSAVMCGQARIQWRIECNTRRSVNVSGGHCAAMPICVGDNCNAMEHAQLIQQWKTACALERLASEDGSGIPGGGGGDGLLDWAQGVRDADTADANAISAQGDGLDGVTEADAWRKPQPDDGEGVSETLFGGGSPTQCTISGGFELMGHSIDPGPQFWWLMGWIGWLLPALAYLWLAQKLGE